MLLLKFLALSEEKQIDGKHLRDLVDRGKKLHGEVESLEKKKEELDLIKAKLRALANGKDVEFSGTKGAIARVEQKNLTICRVVDAKIFGRVIELAGAGLQQLFTLHPSKGTEKNFDLNALKTLPKKTA